MQLHIVTEGNNGLYGDLTVVVVDYLINEQTKQLPAFIEVHDLQASTNGGLGSTELRRLKQLEEENRQLKRLVAELSLDKHMLQDVLSKKL